jgi:hypothetical protein
MTPNRIVDTSSSAVVNLSNNVIPFNKSQTMAVALKPGLNPHFSVIKGQNGQPYAVVDRDDQNPVAYKIGSKPFNNLIRLTYQSEGKVLKKPEITDITDQLAAHADIYGVQENVWTRVAPIQNGIEIDVCDSQNTRIEVTTEGVRIVTKGSKTIFTPNPLAKPMVIPAEQGDLSKLKKYINLNDVDFMLFVAWLSYTLAHPKTCSSKFVILALLGDQGTGKSLISRYVINALIDPSQIDLQKIPDSTKDVAVAAQYAHVLCYDNIRHIGQKMSDTFCIASTGGGISSRALYTDDTQHVNQIHVALALNGIHSFVTQSDLAQRCLTLRTRAFNNENRKSEEALRQEFEAELPIIFRGMLDLIAGVFRELPTVTVSHPERMIDFVYWLAAMEKVNKVPAGVYQSVYSERMNDDQLDTLLDNTLAARLVEFAQTQEGQDWEGTPAELLMKLEDTVSTRIIHSKDWPRNPIALSKRLVSLKASLQSQGISVELHRGKQRLITIKA